MATILISDDTPCLVTAISHAVRRAGHLPLAARDGEQAWLILQMFHVDLLILDRHMPALNGEALVCRLRAQPRFATLPVILTGTGERPDLEAVWMAKPVQGVPLQIAMQELLRAAGDAPTYGQRVS